MGDLGLVDGEPDPQGGAGDLDVGGVGAGPSSFGLSERLDGVLFDVEADPSGRVDLGDCLTSLGLGGDGGLDAAAGGRQPDVERIDRREGSELRATLGRAR